MSRKHLFMALMCAFWGLIFYISLNAQTASPMTSPTLASERLPSSFERSQLIANVITAAATVLQAIAIIYSLKLIYHQVEQQTKQTEQQSKQAELQTEQAEQQTEQAEQQTELVKATHAQKLFELASTFNMLWIQDREIAEMIVNGHREYDYYDPVDKARYRATLLWRLSFQSIMRYQVKRGLLDKGVYKSWEVDFKEFIKRRNVKRTWPHMEKYFTDNFRQYVNDLIAEIDAEGAE